jgi:hypothetical protein
VDNALVRQFPYPSISHVEPWTFSHIDWHFDEGLAIVLAEDVPAIAETDPPRKFNYSLDELISNPHSVSRGLGCSLPSLQCVLA